MHNGGATLRLRLPGPDFVEQGVNEDRKSFSEGSRLTWSLIGDSERTGYFDDLVAAIPHMLAA